MKYSILIPTRNGDRYLKPLVESILNESYTEFELIVSFNNSLMYIPDWAHEVDDIRFKFISPGKEISMAKNYEFILKHAKRDWISLIGDDDGITPNFFNKLDFYIGLNPNYHIHMFQRAYYFWPDMNKKGIAKIRKLGVVKSEEFNYDKTIKNLLNLKIKHFDLPQCYTNNIISKEVIRNWIDSHKSENLIREDNPDIYSSAVFYSMKNINVMKHSEPIFWVGSSNKSIGYSKRPELLNIEPRVQEFISYNERDKIKISPRVSRNIWLQGNDLIFFFSALDRLPSNLKSKNIMEFL